MKKTNISFVLILFALSLFSQKVQYSISAGSNYSFFSLSFSPKIKTENVFSFANIRPRSFSGTSFFYKYPVVIQIKEIESFWEFGFYISNYFCFPISERLSFKTGLGFSKSRTGYKVSFFSTPELPYNTEDSSKFIYPFFKPDAKHLSSVLEVGDSAFVHTLNSNYTILSINTPLQIQANFLKNSFIVSAGFSFFTIIRAKNSPTTNTIIVEKYINNNDFSKVLINFHSDIEYKVYKNLFLSLFYIRSLSDVKSSNTFEIPLLYSSFDYKKLQTNTNC